MCSSLNCYEEHDKFDNLFCRSCRDLWRRYVEMKKFNCDTKESLIEKGLKEFQNNI